MTERQTNSFAEADVEGAVATAGALLCAARKASGLSIDAVAQQLKLAPRQVRAIEEDDYTHLPGRTFIRGFVRNYARLVRVDPDKVLAALPGSAATPALNAPTLQPTAPTIGELPTTERSKVGWTRWAIPLTLVAVVAAAAVYEWLRLADVAHAPPANGTAVTTEHPAAAPAAPDQSATQLPNPLATSNPAASPAPSSAAVQPSATAPVPAAASRSPASEQALSLAYRDYSWTEIRDRAGRVLLSGMNPGGTVQNVAGTPPFEIVIGNASDVRLTYKGNRVDLAPYTRQNVARFKLP